MSESNNNSSRRKEVLKNILHQLHEGKPVDEIKKEFAAFLQEVSAEEIPEIEQMLIDDGMPVAEIQNLCDLHVAIFRESLDQQEQPEMIPGHPVYSFREENREAANILESLRKALEELTLSPNSGNLKIARMQLEKMKEYNLHYLREENLLFPYLEQYNFSGPSAVMWGIHDDIRDSWNALLKLLESGSGNDQKYFVKQVEKIFTPFETATKEMFYKENKILYPAALERLSETDWGDIRSQEADIGYCYIKPGFKWQPKGYKKETTPLPSTSEANGNKLALKTGALTLDQVNLMLTNLPLDLTFVDEFDTVRFFSDTEERIFPRSPAIIGRKVQKCHPPQSVDRVQKILDDFRSGSRKQADFWIQMQGKFIYIRYFALRDEQGSYRGTLEITQEVSDIRLLEGEKRLMD